MSGFTPGPWMAPSYSSVVGLGIIAQGRGQVIATIAVAPGFNPTGPHEVKRDIAYADEVRANARLIAAAPDLYDTINRVADQLVSIEGRTKGDKLRLLDQLHVLRAAARKARGDQA